MMDSLVVEFLAAPDVTDCWDVGPEERRDLGRDKP